MAYLVCQVNTLADIYIVQLFFYGQSMKANKSSKLARIVGLGIIGVLVAGFVLPQLLR